MFDNDDNLGKKIREAETEGRSSSLFFGVEAVIVIVAILVMLALVFTGQVNIYGL